MVRFGPFSLDHGTRRLTRQGRPIHLTPKAFELLGELIRAAPRVVTKDELHARLWPSHAVTDATLVGLIKELRRALSDNTPERRLIRTVHRVGYALDSSIEPSETFRSKALLVLGQRRIGLVAQENLVGRDASCEVWIDNPTVSRAHARIVVEPHRVTVEDLGSKNGTRVVDELLTECRELRDGDRLQFGDIDAVFREARSTQQTATQESPRRCSAPARG